MCSRSSLMVAGALILCLTVPDIVRQEANAGAMITACTDCHGLPPRDAARAANPQFGANVSATAGNHQTHATTSVSSCRRCHNRAGSYTTGHADTFIHLSSPINRSPAGTAARYGTKGTFFNQTSRPVLQSCANLNCHFETTTPLWGTDPTTTDCNSCHGAPPFTAALAHTRHQATLGGYGNDYCRHCHPDHHAETKPFDHATSVSHGRSIFVRLSGAGTYTASSRLLYPNFLPSQLGGTTGSCANVYCHSDSRGTSQTLDWSGGPLTCASCHRDMAADGAATGQHPRHAQTYPFGCAVCHGNGYSATAAAYPPHVNSVVNLAFAVMSTGTIYSKGTAMAPNTAYGTCTASYCHSNGQGTTVTTPSWGSGSSLTCNGCHSDANGSGAQALSGKHRAHLSNFSTLGRSNGLSCVQCHARTVNSNSTIRSTTRHVNGLKDYSGARAGTFAAGTCTTAYCHSTGMGQNQFWNMTAANWASARSLTCSGCHGAPRLPDGTFAAFTSVAGEPNYANGGLGTATANSHQSHVPGAGITSSTGCASCHRTTVDAGVASKFRDFSTSHLDGMRTVAFAPALQGRYSSTTQQCLNIYCHSNAVPFDNSTTIYATVRWGDTPRTCASCHDTGGTTSLLSGRHAKHTGGFYAFTCSRCHFNTMHDDGTLKNKALHTNRLKDISFREGGSYTAATKGCSSAYCHSDGRGGAPTIPVTWGNATPMTCFSCHKGRPDDSSQANCDSILGVWSTSRNSCSPDLSMATNGHHRLVGPQWVRKYPCSYCHSSTVTTAGTIASAILHLNGTKDVAIAAQWAIVGRPAPSYNPTTKVCNNVYCHSDGTSDPEDVRPFAWTEPKTACNSCHGHPTDSCVTCHDGHTDSTGKVWTTITAWPGGEEWRGAMPMFPNQGAGTARANSHVRHSQTNFTCDNCHAATVINGVCTDCHTNGIPLGGMGEVAHINAAVHVNKSKDVAFKDGGSYNPVSKSCANTKCHTSGTDPVWGGSVNSAVTCLSCHGTSGADQDGFSIFNGTQARISLGEWTTRGHGRYSTAGRYPSSNNPAANFPGNPCWYCHDNNVLHSAPENPYRLKIHRQYERRFAKECVYCHMERTDAECIGCHVGQTDTLAPQATGSGIVFKLSDSSTETRFPTHTDTTTCTTAVSCHDTDSGTFSGGSHKGHNVNAGIWTPEQKLDVKQQYLMMGVCLQCHDDDSGGQCTSCHTAPPTNPDKFALGYDPGTGYIKPKQARASAGHFGYKHYRAFVNSGGWTKVQSATKSPLWGTYSSYQGTWKGGKFCWDCHDPHGDSNIFMVHKKVATTTDGIFGRPVTTADVTFTDKLSGTSYARKVYPFDGICNVCHSPGSKHFTSNSGDGHNMSRVCTSCHEHRFADSHANKQSCSTAGCHLNAKPVPKHTAFGLPRDCTKCHLGTVGQRMDVIGQMKSNSHHVQRTDGEIKNTDCYQCHWEAAANGLINSTYHTGYNYKTYTSVKNDVVDLVVYGPGARPESYRTISTADGRATVARFLASSIGTPQERSAVTTITNHCVSCHSDQNNDSTPFNDCKTPRQYAWDGQSIEARYGQLGTTSWGKYAGTAGAAKKNFTKAFSAHGNAAANQGGWDAVNGLDGDLTGKNQRTGSKSVQCFDCHNSHGSKVVGTTSSYVTYNGTNNGANLKETKQNIGGYAYDYKASSNASGANPYAAGAGQCFDCHNSASAGTTVPTGKTPWGYFSTYSSSAPVMGYRDTPRFGNGAVKGFIARNNGNGWLDSKKTIIGGHLKASEPAGSLPNLAKDTGSASGGSLTTLIDAGKNWGSNSWRNLAVLMTSGANSGQLSKISANTGTTLTVEGFTAAVASGDGYKIVPYSAQINGLCTPCHDPHGVSPSLGATNQQYGVPLLKGTWMTSPYKEDAPPPVPTGDHIGGTYAGSGDYNGKPRSWGKWVSGNWWNNHPSPTEPVTRYNLDRTAFGGATRVTENASQFAGLCLNCHQQGMLTDGVNRNNGAAGFKTVDRIHESVKGWGVNSEHSFTCAKCHQPHNSGLPRLMLTNCLDYNHRGGIAAGGQPWAADKQVPNSAHGNWGEHRGFPIGSLYYSGYGASVEATTACHVSRFAPAYSSGSPPAQWPAENYWNSVTPW